MTGLRTSDCQHKLSRPALSDPIPACMGACNAVLAIFSYTRATALARRYKRYKTKVSVGGAGAAAAHTHRMLRFMGNAAPVAVPLQNLLLCNGWSEAHIRAA